MTVRRAAEWWEKSAGQGNAIGQYCLAQLYAAGLGVPKDLGHAEHLFKLRRLKETRTRPTR
jgi:TPR repeat protein